MAPDTNSKISRAGIEQGFMPAGLLILNAWICAPLFFARLLIHLHSNETSFMALARFLQLNLPHISWFPWWDLGMPIQNSYSPVVPAVTALGAWLSGAPVEVAYHFLCATCYCIGPVALYFLCLRLGSGFPAAVAGSLLISLTSPSAWLFAAVRDDLGGLSLARRLQAIAYYGEGPHNIGLSLVPFVLIAAVGALRRGRVRRFVLAGLGLSIVALTNSIGAVAMAIGMTALFVAWRGWAVDRTRWIGLLATALFSYAVVCPFLPPKLLALTSQRSQISGGYFPMNLLTAGAWIAILTVAFTAGRLMPGSSLLARFAAVFSIFALTIPSAGYWADFSLVPLPRRYHHEAELAAALLAAAGAQFAWRKIPAGSIRRAIAIGAGIFFALQANTYHGHSRRLVREAALQTSPQFQAAVWFRDHSRSTERIMAGGDTGFLLNLFVDNPQLGSGHEPTSPNLIQSIALFQIYTGMNAGDSDADVSITWLRALGVRKILVPGPALPRNSLQPFTHPGKFDGKLQLCGTPVGSRIYCVPGAADSLIRLADRTAIVRTRPVHGLDLSGVQRYADSIDANSLRPLKIQWIHPGRAAISANFRQGDVIAAAINYHPGWRAFTPNGPARTEKDGLGLLVVEPGCVGECLVHLEYGPDAEQRVCRQVSLATLCLVALWLLADARPSQPDRQPGPQPG